jgi:hypothetical protein
MRVLLSAYERRRGVEPVVVAVRLRTLGAQVRVCAPPDCAAAEGCDALVVTGVMPACGDDELAVPIYRGREVADHTLAEGR